MQLLSAVPEMQRLVLVLVFGLDLEVNG